MLEKLYVRATNDLGYLTQSYAKYMQIDWLSNDSSLLSCLHLLLDVLQAPS